MLAKGALSGEVHPKPRNLAGSFVFEKSSIQFTHKGYGLPPLLTFWVGHLIHVLYLAFITHLKNTPLMISFFLHGTLPVIFEKLVSVWVCIKFLCEEKSSLDSFLNFGVTYSYMSKYKTKTQCAMTDD